MYCEETQQIQQMRFVSKPRVKKKKAKDCFQAYLIEGAETTKNEGYPIIPRWMIPNDVEDIKIIPFTRWKEYKKNLNEYYICFYCLDKDIQCVINNPRKYLKLFRRARGIIGFDYSIYSDMPPIKQKSQINNNLALSFYYGMRYVNIIPNVRYGITSTKDEFLSTIPKNSIICVGAYGCVGTLEEEKRFKAFLEEMLPVLEPEIVVVYGSLPKSILDEFEGKYKFIQCKAISGYDKGVV